MNKFFEALGVSPDDVPETSQQDDKSHELSEDRGVMLYKISDASGGIQVTEVSGMPLTQDMLNPAVSISQTV